MSDQVCVSARNLLFGAVFLFFFGILGGCDPKSPPDEPLSLPYRGESFALLTTANNGGPLKNLFVLDHSSGDITPFLQENSRVFSGQKPQSLGFHPGVLKVWPRDPAILLFAAEGDNAIKALNLSQPLSTLSSLAEEAPRYLSIFEWPGWGMSLAVSPYKNGVVTLLKNYDPQKGNSEARIPVRLAESPYTIRAAERISVGDIDGDSVPELLMALPVTAEVMVIRNPQEAGKHPEMATVLYQDSGLGMPSEVHPFDLDEDGDLDLVVPDEGRSGKIHFLQNDGTGHFQDVRALDFPGGEGAMELQIARDRDGRVYFLGVSFGQVVLFQKPEGDPFKEAWANRTLPWRPNSSQDIRLEDLDGDGWLDGVIAKYSGDHNLWVVFGPLWDRFAALSDRHYEIP